MKNVDRQLKKSTRGRMVLWININKGERNVGKMKREMRLGAGS